MADDRGPQRSLTVGDGWRLVASRRSGHTLLTDGEDLTARDTAFTGSAVLGFLGGLVCPIAVDHVRKAAYRAVSPPPRVGPLDPDEWRATGTVEIHRFDLRDRKATLVTRLPHGLDCIWMLTLLPTRDLLLALVTERRDHGRFYIGQIDLRDGSIALQLLPDEAFYPFAVHPGLGRVVFSARFGGAVLIGFDGRTIATTSPAGLGDLRGATFIGADGGIVIGGKGLYLWRPHHDHVDRLTDGGNQPVWRGGTDLWFNRSDGAIARFDLRERQVHPVAALDGLDLDQTGFGAPVVFSPDGRIALARLAGRRLHTDAELQRMRQIYGRAATPFPETARYCHELYLCVCDLDERAIWWHQGYAHHVALVEGEFAAD